MVDRSPHKGPGFAGWGLRLLIVALAVAGLSRLWTGPAPLSAQPVAAGQARIVIPPGRTSPLPGLRPGQVRTMLNIREPLRYGEFRWDETGVPAGRILIRVDRQAQILSVFRGGHEIGTAVVLYGAPQKPTPAGTYPVLGKTRFHRSRLYDADMPFSIWLTHDGVAIHASRVREGAATHGCIGLPQDFARKLFDMVRKGDPVVIV
jgi:lipoprotein-anchoring transpeptidase ErfK/SrfK